MPDRYGASPDRWAYFSETLGLTADLLPVVSNPNATISPKSKIAALGKTPSLYNRDREAVGLAKWTQRVSTAAQVGKWAQEPDYGIAVQTRRLRAIDIDVEDEALAEELVRFIIHEGFPVKGSAVRRREDSGKCLIPFMYAGALRKHVIPVKGGVVEILADGQQFIAEGLHSSGKPYRWQPDLLGHVVHINEDWWPDFLDRFTKRFATGEIRVARRRQDLNGSTPLDLRDPVAEWLVDNWEIYDVGQEGQVYLACPFADEHTTAGNITGTAYFPAGTGGYVEGNFVCLHAHCTGREQAEFLNACGFVAGGFDELPTNGLDGPDEILSSPDRKLGTSSDENHSQAEARQLRQTLIVDERWPRLVRDSNAKIEPTMGNLLLALGCPAMTHRRLALDEFREEIVWSPLAEDPPQWRPFRDSDYARLRRELEHRGFKPFGADMLRLAVLTAAEDEAIDTAREWLTRLRWDGTPRLEGFCARAWGWEQSAYAGAVGRYVWTALAGRVLEPGCQADMAPVLCGDQGLRKTAALKAMSPTRQAYLTIKLDAHDDDSSRKLRGKLIINLEELRGLNSRAIEEIKAWITKTHEEWVPKWREFSTSFARRGIFFADTNEDEFLADPTGERRWLPGRCVEPPDDKWVEANRDQLWAEGALLFRLDGVDWQDAERLARDEHGAFKIADVWEPFVRRWLFEDQMQGKPIDWPVITAGDALAGAIGLPLGQIDHGRKLRMTKIFRSIGLKKAPRHRDGEELVSGWAWPASKG